MFGVIEHIGFTVDPRRYKNVNSLLNPLERLEIQNLFRVREGP